MGFFLKELIMPKMKHDLQGKRFGSWSVLHYHGYGNWHCKCDCGIEKPVQSNSLRTGKSTRCASCANTQHGMEGSPTYETWATMKQRCGNPKARAYADYGGRGIKVCDEWQKFDVFFYDMGVRPDGMSIDRIDPNKGYAKDNCRWATPKQQARNKRSTKKYEWNGGLYALGDLADLHGIYVRRVQQRINAGWSLANALTKPIR
jgi:hypothetical protein